MTNKLKEKTSIINRLHASGDVSQPQRQADQSMVYRLDWTTILPNSHHVQFYDDDAFLIKSIKKYAATGDAVIIIATPEHRSLLEKAVRNDKRKPKTKYLFLDARETLGTFMVDGIPDMALFNKVVGGLIKKVSKEANNIRAYGEMVAILWAEGNKAGAIRLEELWNNLQKKLSFTLYCAYPMKVMEGSHTDSFAKVCNTHSHIVPAESYMTLDTLDMRLREIAILQQKASALEAEVARREEAENSLLESVNQLKLSEEFNRNIVESSADCIKTLDLQARLLSFNAPGCRIFEIDDVSQFLGKDWRALWKGEYYNEAKNAFAVAKNGGVGRFQGMCATAKGTPKWWDVMVSPILDNQGKVQKLISVSRDITYSKELEQRKDDFLNATSHELKTPLTSQKVFVELLQQLIAENKDEKYMRYVAKIGTQTDKLTSLVQDLLDVSKIQGGKLVLSHTPFDIVKCIQEAVDEVQAISPAHKILVQGHINQNVIGDKEKLCQVIVNLLTNAVKYSPQASKVIVTLKQEGGCVLVSVKDFGIGINKKDQGKIFDRFYRVCDTDEKTYPGLGMGLYISSEIIKQHQGKIDVKSIKGKSSIFSFSLPLI
ncbi:MAG: ATP-binding protein [bacterium]|nr:ATP-binding protein [bacterium]